MYEAVTRGIRVRVEPEFDGDRTDPDRSYYFWLYTIEIANESDKTIQVASRHWHIADSAGATEEVEGPGVVGQTPVIEPGRSFSYTSGCPLRTPSGMMFGTYQVLGEDGSSFEIEIPAFSLDSPLAQQRAN